MENEKTGFAAMVRRGIVPAVAALAVATSATLPTRADVTWELATPLPLPIDSGMSSEWQTSSWESLYLTGGGFAAAGFADEQPSAIEPTFDSVQYRLESASWGMCVSEFRGNFNLGDWCNYLPEGEIDWAATQTAITNSAAYKQGYLFYDASSDTPEKRVIFTRGGEIEVPWILTNGTTVAKTYTVGQTTTARPYRLFWTESPFTGPKIDLSAHPHIRLLGDPEIIKPVYEATATSAQTGVSNIVRGVVFDDSAKVLRCYARVIDAEAGQYDGPEGQIVVAYYDGGQLDNLVATIVVEISAPDVQWILASVGDELRPSGGGYDIDGLESEIQAGANAVTGDDASPYLEKHQGRTNWSPKHKSVFAISPTDSTTTKNGEDAPWRADIYWKAPDPMDVLWPFEEDWYLISWPADAPSFIVSGDKSAPGLPIFAPTNLTTEVCAYQSPANIATAANDGTVSATSAGWFTLRMKADDDIWYLPVHAVLRTEPGYGMANAPEWQIGNEITLKSGAAAQDTQGGAESVDRTLPGYIYEAASTGRKNWNTSLYHEPKQASATDGMDDSSDDPYAALESAIYPVNTSTSPIEVWWSCSVDLDDGGGKVKIPCVAQRYTAVWPDRRDVQTITIASQKGSDGNLPGASESAIFFNSTNDFAVTVGDRKLDPGLTGGLTIGFWVNPSPAAAECPPCVSGQLATLRAATNSTAFAFRLDAEGATPRILFSTTSDSGTNWTDVASQSLETNAWTHIALALDAGEEGAARAARIYVNAAKVWEGDLDVDSLTRKLTLILGMWMQLNDDDNVYGASGVAMDAISFWLTSLDETSLTEVLSKVDGSATADLALQCRFSFDSASDLLPAPIVGARFASDPFGGHTLQADGMLKMSPGAPVLYSGIVKSDDGVAPLVYTQNDASLTGFNPNDEHAFLVDSPTGGKVVHALRCDLATDETSQPFVLVQYADGGKGAMRIYGVALTNEVYSTLGSTRTAGLALTPPNPLAILDYAENANNFAVTVTDPATVTNWFGDVTDDREVVYFDRNRRMWARRNGLADGYYYYAMREGFWLPGLSSQPATGTFIPWLARVTSSSANLLSAAPMPWRWDVEWPDDDEVPTMKVAQTLTTADSGLPEVWSASSMAVIFPAPVEASKFATERVVHLIDPTVMQSQPLAIGSSFPDEYGFTLGSSGTTQLKSGKYYFTGTPPSVSDRFYVDAANQRICLVGQYVEKATGGSYLQLNVLSPAERETLRELCKGTDEAKARWREAVDALATDEVLPNTTSRKTIAIPAVEGLTNAVANVSTTYSPVDHYALVASGEGAGYVTIIENDSPDKTMVSEGSTISVHVIKVLPELYDGGLTVITDPLNKLSEQLTIAYTSPFGAAANDYEFEWRRVETTADGSVPTNYPDWRVYGTVTDGLTSILLGANGADLKDLQNMYYAMRYRAKESATARSVVGEEWSGWCGPTLAEGWVQRVLNAVTPFAQRCTDFSSYESDISYSMLQQIGAPYHGDVALNNDNLNNVGLLELYMTVLNKADAMSLKLGAKTDAGVNKQLLLAASRIAELYDILGDEAYSDAKNPTVSQMFSGTEYTYDSLSSSVFCFQNQLPTLLDEELALLRGRTSAVAPNMTTYPYYNRLIWNFTKGVTEGEVAYVNNYMIYGSDGEISAEQAATQYPQGHGDAYGHYLSKLKMFYRLARNPYFDWYATMTEMLIGDSIVNVDYFDEEKFAEAAGDVAQTALDTIDLTARKAWKDSDGVAGSGYFDSNETQAFGYGEWATRGGYGALCNWAVVNALLPTNGAPVDAVFEDKGISRINRSTASSLGYLPSVVREMQAKLDALDAGRNPLGFSDNAIPFDIAPDGVSHFEQILERAEKALANAQTVQDYAAKYGSRIAQINLQQAEAEDDHEAVEAEYVKNLVAIYGTPLAGDIGPSGTYAQGYTGPDVYHYMYVDLAPYGLSAIDSALSKSIVYYSADPSDPVSTASSLTYSEKSTVAVTYTLTPDGIPQAPKTSGVRTCEGSIQSAYRDFLAAYVKVKQRSTAYDRAVAGMQVKARIAQTKLTYATVELAMNEVVNASAIFKAGVDLATGRVVDALSWVKETVDDGTGVAYSSTPKVVGAGLTVNVDPSAVAGAVAGTVKTTAKAAASSGIYGAKTIAAAAAFYKSTLDAVVRGIEQGFDFYDAEVAQWEALKSAVSAVTAAADELQQSYTDLVAAEQVYRAKIAEGEALREELTMQRKHWANTATSARYADMYNRIERNNALTKYSTAFDTAQRYVYMLAKVYDYETGLLSTDSLAGDNFLRNVVASRSLGEAGITTESNSTLWDAVTRMSENWDSLKGRLGVNNPEESTTWFSLRYSLFRISPGEDGDEAWRTALRQCWRDDILMDGEFRRYCQPPESENAGVGSEPGLVITFPTTINLAENFFGRPLLGGEATFSSSDYAVKVNSVGIRFKGYDALAVRSQTGLATTPNVYFVPVGSDYMRSPFGTTRETLVFKVVDEVMPIPYSSGEITSLLADPDWISVLATGDDSATIRRHSTMRVTSGDEATSSRLVGRSVWNDKWMLVIPASSLSSDRVNALKTFIYGLDTDKDGKVDVPGVSDIEIGIRAYSRSGN